MASSRREALEYHSTGSPGKIEVVPTKSVSTQRDLTLAYSPGVAEPCREIADRPDDVFKYTARGNLVAVVSNGTAVLGLGNIGPLAAKPVMEGKGVLFKRFAGIDVFDLEVDAREAEDVIRFCEMLGPTVGGINLEDIAAPECFVIERTLRETLDIPVFHDDQHGTAIIAAAAFLNALDLVDKKVEDVRVVFSGAGASALSTASHLRRLGASPENIVLCDSRGVIHNGRDSGMNEYKEPFAVATEARTLGESLVGADVFIGLSVKGIVSPEMVRSMARDPIIFALANPDPEILPEEARAVRGDAIIATGRSDYPNQVNNVLGFPFIFRGALDVRARGINEEMMLAATLALAELARQEVPEAVRGAYSDNDLRFGRDYLIPKPFDHRVLFYVAPAVAEAAIRSGLARKALDLAEYRDSLHALLGPGRALMSATRARARARPARVVFPEGHNVNVIRAASELAAEGACRPVLLGRPPRVAEKAEWMGLDMSGVEVVYAAETKAERRRYADELYRKRARKGLTLAEARWNLFKPVYFGLSMLQDGAADAMVAGIEAKYSEVLRSALHVVGSEEGIDRVSGLHVIALRNRDLVFLADTTVNIDPDAETLRDIAVQTATFVRRLGVTPRVAMVTFSNFGSVRHEESLKMARAVELVRAADPELEIDGEMQADTAVDQAKLENIYQFTHLSGPANVLIFSRLSAANAAYKLLDRLGGADSIGPILLGMAKPLHILERGCSVQHIVNLATIATVDWQTRARSIDNTTDV